MDCHFSNHLFTVSVPNPVSAAEQEGKTASEADKGQSGDKFPEQGTFPSLAASLPACTGRDSDNLSQFSGGGRLQITSVGLLWN